MYAFIGLIPIVLAIIFMLVLKKSAGFSMFCAWVSAVIFAVIYWDLAPAPALAYTTLGFLSAIDVLCIIFFAVFLLNILLELRFIQTIANGFNQISQDRRIQILIIAFFFGAFIEGAAGFGSPAALAAPLLVGLGIPPFFAALSSLFANTASTAFGAAGTPITVGYTTIAPGIYNQLGIHPDEYFSALNIKTAFINIFMACFVPFLMITIVVMRDGKKRGVKDALNIFPLCFFAGFVFTVPAWLASLLSPALPTLIGALVGLALMILAVRKNFLVPKEVYRFKNDPMQDIQSAGTGINPIKAWTPYALIAFVLVLSRLPWLPFVYLIRHPSLTLNIHNIFGFEGINWAWAPLNNPGLLPFMPIAVIFLFAGGLKNKLPQIGKMTVNQLKNAAFALMFGIALVQIMRFTNFSNPHNIGSMTTEIAIAFANIFGNAYLVIAPFIGMLGSFVAGSTTVSNIMFYSLQMETAFLLGLPTVMTLVSQNLGAAVGNAIAINNVVAAAATTNIQGKENELIKSAVIPVFLFGLAISLILFLANMLGINWLA